MDGGHYTAYCRNIDYNKWFKFDDCNVMELKGNEVRSSNAYILFYCASDVEIPLVVDWRDWTVTSATVHRISSRPEEDVWAECVNVGVLVFGIERLFLSYIVDICKLVSFIIFSFFLPIILIILKIYMSR